MKKVFAVLFLMCFYSCSTDDDSLVYDGYNEILPVVSANVPGEFQLGQTYEISLQYISPSTCHVFSDIYYTKTNHEITVAIIAFVYESNDLDCVAQEVEKETSFNFRATHGGTYTFKFWLGENEQGENDYLVVEVPVNE